MTRAFRRRVNPVSLLRLRQRSDAVQHFIELLRSHGKAPQSLPRDYQNQRTMITQQLIFLMLESIFSQLEPCLSALACGDSGVQQTWQDGAQSDSACWKVMNAEKRLWLFLKISANQYSLCRARHSPWRLAAAQ